MSKPSARSPRTRLRPFLMELEMARVRLCDGTVVDRSDVGGVVASTIEVLIARKDFRNDRWPRLDAMREKDECLVRVSWLVGLCWNWARASWIAVS